MIQDHMKSNVLSVSPATTVREAAHLVVNKHIGTLPVVDENHKLVGVVRLEDLLKVFMPDFVELMDDIDFVHDFGALESLQPHDNPEVSALTMADLMMPPFFVEGTCGMLRALATMVKHEVRDLPVVDKEKRLIGIASRVDVAIGFLQPWVGEGERQ